jgi:hypothetical protein
MPDTAIFLGAGASKAEGAPLQGELFRDYFSPDIFKSSHDNMDRELATFFLEMFQIDVDREDTEISNSRRLRKFSVSPILPSSERNVPQVRRGN